MITRALGAAHAGIDAGLQRMNDAARELTRDVSIDAVMESKMGEAQAKASMAVVKAVDETLGVLVDEVV